MRRGTPVALADLVEKDWDAQLFNAREGLATTLGWQSYHTLRSRGSRSGFPDRTLWRDRVIFAELKREKGKPTDEQVRVLTGLATAGAEVYLWRPSDLEEIGKVLGRWRFDSHSHHLFVGITGDWMPLSLWLPAPAGCRVDEA